MHRSRIIGIIGMALATAVYFLGLSVLYRQCYVPDGCHDRGGSWDAERNQCVGEDAPAP